MNSEYNYYEEQLEGIERSLQSFHANFKISTGDGKSTKNMALNDESAQILKDWLEQNFNVK